MKRLLLWIYQVGLITFGAVYLLARVLRGRDLPGLRERLAAYSPEVRQRLAGLRGPVWIHLVSVGEVLAARPFIEELRSRFPQRKWVVTTTTPTGREVARKSFDDGKTQLLYLPWDFGPVVDRALNGIKPALFISFETELWPVLFDRLGRRGIPIVVVNGRISPRAYRRYLWVRPLMQRALEPVSLFITQSPQDARRYAALGAAKDRVTVSGNLKWDLGRSGNGDSSNSDELRRLIGLAPGQALWVAGSTHEGEERHILQAYSFLRGKFPKLKLVIAPRHPERTTSVEQEIQATPAEGWKPVRYSALKQGAAAGGTETVLLLDTVGDLAGFYAIADVVFVGGSLVPHGGHNLIEPASLHKPILSGPYLHNFQAISELLQQAKGMIIVQNGKELEQAVERLLQSPAQARELGERAHAVFLQNQGAVRRTADLIALRWGKALS